MNIPLTVMGKLQTLPTHKQQEVLDFVEFLQAKAKETEALKPTASLSVLAAAGDLMGCVEGSGDLSTKTLKL